MVRAKDKKERKEKILYLIVRSFIKTCSPISSEFLSENFDLPCSPATVRNDMAELEEEGFLYQPHTSAGRIPTQKAYRYFVNFFLEKKGLLEEERNKIMQILNSTYNLDTLLNKTSHILADITHQIGLVSLLWEPEKVYTHGLKYIAQEPEFKDLQKLGAILELLEDEDFIWNLLAKHEDEEEKILIGSELGIPELDCVSLIFSSYGGENLPSGKLAILGPLRMDYEKVLGSIEFISKALNDILVRFV